MQRMNKTEYDALINDLTEDVVRGLLLYAAADPAPSVIAGVRFSAKIALCELSERLLQQEVHGTPEDAPGVSMSMELPGQEGLRGAAPPEALTPYLPTPSELAAFSREDLKRLRKQLKRVVKTLKKKGK